MLLDIVVPHYNESTEIIRPFFDVLEAQKGVDFNDFHVIFVHDGNEAYQKVKDTFPKYKNLNLSEIVLPENMGVSTCRNYGIDNGTAEWICFCDCDDCFSSIFSMMKIIHVLKDENAKQFDMIWGPFYEYINGRINICDNFNNVFIHNKYYRRSFLIEKGVRFNPKIRMSEDSAFNTIFRMEVESIKRIGKIDNAEPLYSWCRRKGSITMDMSKWIYNTEGHFDRNLYILDEYRLRRRGDSDLMIARTLADAYSMLTKVGVQGDPSVFLNRVRDFYLENKYLFERVSEKKVKQALDASDRDACVRENDILSRPLFKEWLAELISQPKQPLK